MSIVWSVDVSYCWLLLLMFADVQGEDESEDSDRDEFLESAGEDETEDQVVQFLC